MELPSTLLRAIEDLASGTSTSELQKAAQRLSERYRDSKRHGQPLLSDRCEAAAGRLEQFCSKQQHPVQLTAAGPAAGQNH